MKILHLYSDWKWTGPAEPVLQMCSSLLAAGHEVQLCHCAAPRPCVETVGDKARLYRLHASEQFALSRHIPLGPTFGDLRRLPAFIAAEKFDVVHTHLSHDGAFGGFCCKLLGRQRPPVVRTLHLRSVLPPTMINRVALRLCADGLLTFTEGFRQATIDRFGLPPERVGVQPMPIDVERFSPDRPFRDMRPVFGFAPDAPVIGIVGRFQKYRKADVFLEAASLVLQERPDARFVVLGASSQMEKTVHEPIRRLGIGHAVTVAGYRIEDYDDTLAMLDIFSLLMPGFDGTARAVREAMALGKPCVVSDFGMLPDIVPHDVAGLTVPSEPAALAAGWLRLLRDPAERRRLGAGALAHARAQFRLDRVASSLEAFYRQILALHRPGRG